ncbi:hypothetical protein [Moraxella caviae]|uniref:hypothetical protein n=1 Tax=Moraxella caviae TaxID=34060 RepID=UPI0010545227|nr:hypothetical protein [Moraxella caviae]
MPTNKTITGTDCLACVRDLISCNFKNIVNGGVFYWAKGLILKDLAWQISMYDGNVEFFK